MTKIWNSLLHAPERPRLSVDAEEALGRHLDSIGAEVADAAAAIAIKVGAEGTSAAHVDYAMRQYLVSRADLRNAKYVAVGGLVAGTGSSAFLQAALSSDPVAGWLLGFAGSTMVGIWMLARGLR